MLHEGSFSFQQRPLQKTTAYRNTDMWKPVQTGIFMNQHLHSTSRYYCRVLEKDHRSQRNSKFAVRFDPLKVLEATPEIIQHAFLNMIQKRINPTGHDKTGETHKGSVIDKELQAAREC